jgi:hypothetical protein
MRRMKYSKVPEHGLQVEETLAAGDREGGEHLARYWWAWSIRQALQLPSSVAVDLGCGCAYGTRILSEGFDIPSTTFGVDLDRDTLNLARRDYGGLTNIRLVELPNHLGLDQPWAEHVPVVMDLVTVFDTLEMIRHRDMFLDELTMRLNPNGVALFSAGLYRMASDPSPKDAYFRYSGPTLIRTLKRYFSIVRTMEEDIATEGETVTPFQYVYDLNHTLRQAAQSGEPLQVGADLIYCAKPIRTAHASLSK